MAAFCGTAAAEIFGADRGVEPRGRSPVEGVTEDYAFAAAVADDGDEEAGFADFRSGGSGGVGKPDERNADEAEIRVDERHLFIDGDARVLREKLPTRMFGIADG